MMRSSSIITGKFITALALAGLMLAVFIISGFTVVGFNTAQPVPGNPAAFRLTDVIQNGDFENNPLSSVAAGWQAYDNGGAEFGWYDDRWAETVHSGQHSQLMEIHGVESFQPNRVIAIYQTVNVEPNMHYQLIFQAMMRSGAPFALRNKGDYAMHWGIDYQGRGQYYYVTDWVEMPMVEQFRLGSNGPPDNDQRLFFQTISSTIFTVNTNRLTLFIRGVKINATGTELDFNIDDVSLIGPYFIPTPTPTYTRMPTPTRRPTATQTSTPTTTVVAPGLPVTGVELTPEAEISDPPEAELNHLPDAGGVLTVPLPTGVLIGGTLSLLALGAGAVAGLRRTRQQ